MTPDTEDRCDASEMRPSSTAVMWIVTVALLVLLTVVCYLASPSLRHGSRTTSIDEAGNELHPIRSTDTSA